MTRSWPATAPCLLSRHSVRQFRDVDCATRIDSDAVRCNERAGAFGTAAVSNTREQLPVLVEDTDTRSKLRPVPIAELLSRRKLSNVETVAASGTTHAQAAGTIKIMPLRFIFSVAVEHLNAVVLPIGDVDIAISIAADIVHNIELSGSSSWFAPRRKQPAVRCVAMHAGIAVAI